MLHFKRLAQFIFPHLQNPRDDQLAKTSRSLSLRIGMLHFEATRHEEGEVIELLIHNLLAEYSI
jgi:hypothetical protein